MKLQMLSLKQYCKRYLYILKYQKMLLLLLFLFSIKVVKIALLLTVHCKSWTSKLSLLYWKVFSMILYFIILYPGILNTLMFIRILRCPIKAIATHAQVKTTKTRKFECTLLKVDSTMVKSRNNEIMMVKTRYIFFTIVHHRGIIVL